MNIVDKGVISEIRPTEEMPILETGERVHMICNVLGVVNRLNPGQLYEIELNFISNQIRHKMEKLKSFEEKESLLFEYLNDVNQEYALKLKTWYCSLDTVNKKDFINDCIMNHIYIEQPPMYGNITFEQLEYIYDKYKIKPVNAYVKAFGKMVKIRRPVVAAEKYTIKLKHHLYSWWCINLFNCWDIYYRQSAAKYYI